MKRFGVIAETGPESIRVTNEAIQALHPRDASEQGEALRELAVRPDAIRHFLAEHPNGLPADKILRLELRDRNFSEEAASTFIKVLRETLTFAGLDYSRASKLGALVPLGEPELRLALGNNPEFGLMSTPIQVPSFQSTASFGVPMISHSPAPVPAVAPPATATKRLIHLELPSGVVLDLYASGDFTPESFDEFKEFLVVYEKLIAKKAAKRFA
jgi:hypothetical protein